MAKEYKHIYTPWVIVKRNQNCSKSSSPYSSEGHMLPFPPPQCFLVYFLIGSFHN